MNDDHKMIIAKQLKPITPDEVVVEIHKLRNITDIQNVSDLSHMGLKIIYYFFYTEMLSTKGRRHKSFYQFLLNFEEELQKDHIKGLFDCIIARQKQENYLLAVKQIFDKRHSSISAFRPTTTMKIINRLGGKKVLDPCMGWGGRLIGSVLSGVETYIGIDSNTKLEVPYNHLLSCLREHHNASVCLFFQDALQMDYSKLNYDSVICSPPFYNLEQYEGQPLRSKGDWNQWYYILFHQVWKYLKDGGYMALHLNHEMGSFFTTFLHQPQIILPLHKYSRQNCTYTENIYVWIKSTNII